MNDILDAGAGVLFMKVGTHAREDLADIIARKTDEIRRTGFGMWGYGGNTCHPSSMVQPFARSVAQHGHAIHLCMQAIESNHFATPLCAAEFSVDGVRWEEIPATIEVRGSRYALVIDNLQEKRFMLPLDRTRVPVGPSMGRLGSRYLKGRVDKACLEMLSAPQQTGDPDPREIGISLVATLRTPYAVFLRGQR